MSIERSVALAIGAGRIAVSAADPDGRMMWTMGEADRPELAKTLAEASGATGDPAPPELAATAAAVGSTADTSPRASHEQLERGAPIGRYIVLDLLGAGGMGVVYRAYDPELDRKVALKLVRHRDSGSGDTGGRGRMLREAQGLAHLSHPNVVAIHDVGTDGQLVFIAMELVEGDTLSVWARMATRSIADILDVFTQAGRGLAAAHRSGLVHRDFKPDNVLVGHDGRTRVVDFGLVREVDGASPFDTVVEPNVRPSEPMLSTPLTQMGVMMGTPLYMAPEQMLDRTTDARTDQYSFCVALYEALAGALPFRGETLGELKDKVLAGKAPAIPAARKVPAHVAAAIRRGMSVEPGARWGSMDDLLAELARDPTARRRRWLVGAGVVALLGAAVTIPLVATGSHTSPCGGAAEQIAGAWGPDRRTALHAAFAATHVPYAEAELASVARGLDQYRDAWIKSYESSCKATHVRGEQSVEMLDLRTACLSSRRIQVSALVDLLMETDAKSLQRAHTAIAGLSAIDDCDDLVALQAPSKLPANATARRAVADLRDELARVQALFYAGRFKEALPRAESVSVRARALGYRPLEAEVGLFVGSVQGRIGDTDAANRTLIAALAAATASRHDDAGVRIATRLAQNAADKQDFAHGHDWIALAEALVERLGNQPARRAGVHYSNGYLLAAEGKYAAAVEEHERALAIRERVAPGSTDLAHTLTSLSFEYDELGRYADARAAGERSLAMQEAELGPSHPELAIILTDLGNVASDEGDLDRATADYKRALAIREQTPSDDPALLANVFNNLGTIAQDQGRFDDALAYHRRALAIREKEDAGSPDVSMSLVNIGAALCSKGDHETALAGDRRALEIAEHRLGKDHPFVGDALAGIGECALHLGKLDESQAVLERALAIRKLGGRPTELAEVQFALARTLWERGQHDRAIELATTARTAFADSPASKRRLVELDGWLHAHGK